MPFADLQSFVAELEKQDQLRRIRAEVDPILEITEIADRVMKSPCPEGSKGAPPADPAHGGMGGRALLFENVRGSNIPVLINAFGSYARIRLALGCEDLEELAQRIQQLVKPEMPTTLMEKLKKLPELARLAGYGPKVVKRGICQEVVHTDEADLLSLPIIQCWPSDGNLASEPPDPGPREPIVEAAGTEGRTGRYITLAGVYARDPDTDHANVGMYRIQVFGPKLAAVHWHVHHDGARIFRKWAARNEPMPMAVVLGGEPVLTYAATCPLPPDVSELLLAGFLNRGGIELVCCKTIPLDVPANAEIVIEGLVHPTDCFLEGPFGDHTGFYSLSGPYPVFRVTAVTRRRDPIYPTTIVGPPPMEDYYLGKATERIFLPLLKMLIPDVIDYHLPMFGAFHNFVFVKIRKEYPYQARKVIHSIWGAGQMMFSKFIVVVDEHVDVHDEQQVFFAVGANVDPRRDTVIADGPLDILDHAAPFEGAGSKMGIDATRKIPGEGMIRRWPSALEMSPAVRDRVTRCWAELGLD
ncbi:MAG TPA: UbiD family decarboxylase [Phycisphaerae bacterium]|nr:UbiD family decarboxylase [Phycisphaerae bacterium]